MLEHVRAGRFGPARDSIKQNVTYIYDHQKDYKNNVEDGRSFADTLNLHAICSMTFLPESLWHHSPNSPLTDNSRWFRIECALCAWMEGEGGRALGQALPASLVASSPTGSGEGLSEVVLTVRSRFGLDLNMLGINTFKRFHCSSNTLQSIF